MREEGVQHEGVVAVIDDDEAARVSIGQMLRLRRYRAESFASAEAALAWPGLASADCVITDIRMPGMDGERFLAQMTSRQHSPPVIMITGHGDVSTAVRCLKAGAYDFVEKPFEDDFLLASVSRAVEKSSLRKMSADLEKRLGSLASAEDGRYGMVGRSRVMLDLYEQIEALAKSNAPVLIYGETGAGKELVARALHVQSLRSQGPFVAVNAAALPETMMESELFGHSKGAFTGADAGRDGKIVSADKGTLLLDEVESISMRAQMQLLRVLEDGQVYALGRDKPREVDVRILAATKQDLREVMKQGMMREDFFHRIMVLSITVPPLRDRTDDIPLLVSHFLKLISEKNGVPVPAVPESAMEDMLRHNWPGNVRELRNAVERMLITSTGGRTGSFSMDESFDGSRLVSLPATSGRLKDEMEQTESRVIEAALRENGGEINATVAALGISRRALYDRMKKYQFRKEDFKG